VLHHEKLLQEYVYLKDPATGTRGIAVLCFFCKQFCIYSDPHEVYRPDRGGTYPLNHCVALHYLFGAKNRDVEFP
jgi:hypothetical protein